MSADTSCPRCGLGDGARMGIEVSDRYDGILYWICTRCDLAYHRFPDGHDLRLRAEPFVSAHNFKVHG